MEPLKLHWLKSTKTSTGKDKIDAEVIKADGTHMDVTIWPDFPNYANLKPEETIQAKIIGKEYKGKMYYSLASESPANQAPYRGNKTAMMDKMMDKKASQIASAQDSKEHSIRLSSTIRDAVLLTTTQIASDPILSKDTAMIKKMIKDWRKYLMEHWDMTTDDYEPFPSEEPVIQVEDLGYDQMFEQI